MLSSDVISVCIKLTKEGSSKFFKRGLFFFFFSFFRRNLLDANLIWFHEVFIFVHTDSALSHRILRSLIRSILALRSVPCSHSNQRGLENKAENINPAPSAQECTGAPII